MRILVKKVLSYVGLSDLVSKCYLALQSFRERFQYLVLYPLVLNVPLLSNIYFMFSKSFSYEAKLFLSSRRDYLMKKHNRSENLFLLRRNIHRLEKGILMKSRKKVFALDYIQETVDLFCNLVQGGHENEQMNWAYDILKQYFEVTDSCPQIEIAQVRFFALNFEGRKVSVYQPFPMGNVGDEDLKSSFKQLVTKRKSVRYFSLGKIPPRELMDEAVEMAGMAPSSCNRQPFEFRIVDHSELAQKVLALAGGTTGFANSISAVVAVVGQMNVSPTVSDRHLMYIDGSLAAMNFMLALESMNISSCPLNWPEDKRKDTQVAKLLSLQKYERPIMLIAYGYRNNFV